MPNILRSKNIKVLKINLFKSHWPATFLSFVLLTVSSNLSSFTVSLLFVFCFFPLFCLFVSFFFSFLFLFCSVLYYFLPKLCVAPEQMTFEPFGSKLSVSKMMQDKFQRVIFLNLCQRYFIC